MMTPVVLLLLVAPLLICSEAGKPRNCSEAGKLRDCSGAGKPRDCSVILEREPTSSSGVYIIYPDLKSGLEVYCDMKDKGWTVIQMRKNGALNFYQPWYRYVRGFGRAPGEYWLGLENMHHLTLKPQVLLVEMEDFVENKVWARYYSFSVGAECEGYKLTVSGFKNGGAGDSLTFHNGMKFTTYDKDQDHWSGNCAQTYYGGWWYNNCHWTNPNGVYRWGTDSIYGVGVIWKEWKGYHYSLKSVTMKIGPSS